MTPTERLLLALANRSCDPKPNGSGWTARCPAHDDQTPSLSVAVGDDGKALVHCFAGCSIDEICAAVGMRVSDLMTDEGVDFDPRNFNGQRDLNGTLRKRTRAFLTPNDAILAIDHFMEKTHGQRVTEWSYHDALGQLFAMVIRYDLPTPDGEKQRKTFRPITKHPDGWRIGDPPGKWPLYRLPEILAADRIVIVEGEQCADVAANIGFVATTSAHGANGAPSTDWSPLAGKECVIMPDNNAAGEHYVAQVENQLSGLEPTPSLKIVNLPDLPDGGDIADWVEANSLVEEIDLKQQLEEWIDAADLVEIRATSIERKRARIELSLIPASQLGDGQSVEWIWHGYLSRGSVSLLVGLWKAGKSTLISHLVKEMESGGDLAGAVHPAKVLVVTEEASDVWARRRDDIGIGDHVHFSIRPFMGRPSHHVWFDQLAHIADSVRDEDFDLVIFDTWQSLNPCRDENDATQMMDALTPLHLITEAGAGVLLVHHPRKGDAAEGQASRGSGALLGFVEVIIEFGYFGIHKSNRRKILAFGRFSETPSEMVIELTKCGYETVGDKSDANQSDRHLVIQEILANGEALTTSEVHQKWCCDRIPKPGVRTVEQDLKQGCESGLWQQFGKGVRGDPHRYKLDSRTHPPLDA